jgi:hypothetical protein
VGVVIGWDIGGAHLKGARVKNGRVEAVVQAATPLWLGLDSLEAAFDALRTELGPADRHVITMTGELCDAFPSSLAEPPGMRPTSLRPIGTRAPRSSRSSFRTRCSSTSARRQPISFRSSLAGSRRSATATRNGSLRANSSIPD